MILPKYFMLATFFMLFPRLFQLNNSSLLSKLWIFVINAIYIHSHLIQYCRYNFDIFPYYIDYVMYNVNLSTCLVSIFISNPLKAGIFLPSTMIYFLTWSSIFTSSHLRLIISREQSPSTLMTPVWCLRGLLRTCQLACKEM